MDEEQDWFEFHARPGYLRTMYVREARTLLHELGLEPVLSPGDEAELKRAFDAWQAEELDLVSAQAEATPYAVYCRLAVVLLNAPFKFGSASSDSLTRNLGVADKRRATPRRFALEAPKPFVTLLYAARLCVLAEEYLSGNDWPTRKVQLLKPEILEMHLQEFLAAMPDAPRIFEMVQTLASIPRQDRAYPVHS